MRTSHTNEVPSAANVRAIIDLERQAKQSRTYVDAITDAVTGAASSSGFILGHVVWFAVWIALNTLFGRRFDPYPFSFLTLIVSLEAIVLTGFVLMSQYRMTQQADRRAHLDLQVNLLAEEELTAILKIVCLIAAQANVDIRSADPGLNRLLDKTDVTALANELDRELSTIEPRSRPQTTAPPSSSP